MDLLTAISLSNNCCVRVIILLACMFIYFSSAQASGSTPSFRRATKSLWLHHERVRRHSTCSGNKTIFGNRSNSNTCFYDHACFELFSDCCWDYREKCGEQESKGSKWPKSMWKCVELFQPIYPCIVVGAPGVWMIHKCPADATLDKLRAKCENISAKFSYPAEDYIPVVGTDSVSYRNKHCALCNGVENFTSWDVRVEAHVVPPTHMDLDSGLKFIEQNGGFIEGIQISLEDVLPRRYCYGKNFVDNCPTKHLKSSRACVEGPVEVVTNSMNVHFKNAECANCSGHPNLHQWKSNEQCIPFWTTSFTIVFKPQNADRNPKTNFQVVIFKRCPRGSVYDTTLRFCRTGYSISSSDKFANEFLVLLWLKKPTGLKSTQENDLKSALFFALTFQFSLLPNQTSTLAFHKQSFRANDYFVATFRLTLTPFQTLLMVNQHKSSLNITGANTAFLRFFNFTHNFTLVWKEYHFTVINVITKQLSFYGEGSFNRRNINLMRKVEASSLIRPGKFSCWRITL